MPSRPGLHLWRASASEAWRPREVWILWGVGLYDSETRARIDTVGGEWGERVGDLAEKRAT